MRVARRGAGAEIRRATTWERPSWKFATGKPSENSFEDPLGLFDFENRDASPAARQVPLKKGALGKYSNCRQLQTLI